MCVISYGAVKMILIIAFLIYVLKKIVLQIFCNWPSKAIEHNVIWLDLGKNHEQNTFRSERKKNN